MSSYRYFEFIFVRLNKNYDLVLKYFLKKKKTVFEIFEGLLW